MWYIYEISNKINNSLEQPKISNYFTVDKMPPKPKGKYIELKADFDNHIVWWGERDKTEEEIKQEQIEKIDDELKQIDNEGVNRHLENQIEASGTYDTIYESTRKLIDRKNELREQRKKLKGEQTEG